MNKNRIYIILGIAGIIALIAIAIFLRKPTIPAPSVTPKSETATPTESVIQTPATEKEKTEVPSTQEKKETKQLSSCVILDEEYCKKGEPIYWHASFAPELQGKLVAIGFELPKGTKIYAPYDGLFGKGVSVIGPNRELIMDIVFVDSLPLENTKHLSFGDVESAIPEDELTDMKNLGMRKEVKKGDLIGRVKGNLLNSSVYGSEYSNKRYTLIIEASQGNVYNFESFNLAPEFLSQYFPYLK
jgi:hypothetical protein